MTEKRQKPNIKGTSGPNVQPSSLAGNKFEGPVTLNFNAILPITSMLRMEIPHNLKTSKADNDEELLLSCGLVSFLGRLSISENQRKWVVHMVKIGILPPDFNFELLVHKLIEYHHNARCIYQNEVFLPKENTKLTRLIPKLKQRSSASLIEKYKTVLAEMLYKQRLSKNLLEISSNKKIVEDANAFMEEQRPILCELVGAFMDLFKKELPKSQGNTKTSFLKVTVDIIEEIEVKKPVSPVIDPIQLLQRASEPEMMLALIIAVLTRDERNNDDDNDLNVLELLEDLDFCRNQSETLFTFKPLFKVAMAFWKTQIPESKKMEFLFVSHDEVDKHMLMFLQKWAKFDFSKTLTISVSKRLFNDVMRGVALLSACSPTPSLMNASLALFSPILEKMDCFDTGVDDEFFQMIAQFLEFPKNIHLAVKVNEAIDVHQRALKSLDDHKKAQLASPPNSELESLQLAVNSSQSKLDLVMEALNRYDMRSVQSMIDEINNSFETLCERGGLSNERDNILAFLASMCSKNLHGFLIVLRTFIGSGKTASLAEFLLSTIRNEETAVFMTPCPSEVMNFLKGIFSQIKDLVKSDVFKALSAKDPFREKFQNIYQKLSNVSIFESTLQLGQTLVAGSTNVFVLESKPENISWVYGISPVVQVLILDDVPCSAEIAKKSFSNNPKCTVIVSGADVGQFEPSDFAQKLEHLNLKPFDIDSLWEKAKKDQACTIWKFFNKHMRSSSTTMSFSGFRDFIRNIGISVVDGQVSSGDVPSIHNMKTFVKNIAVDPIKALEILESWYIKATLPELADVLCKGGTIVFQTGTASNCVETLVSMLKVYDSTPVSARPNGLLKISSDVRNTEEGEDGGQVEKSEEGTSFVNPAHRALKTFKDPKEKPAHPSSKKRSTISAPKFINAANGKEERLQLTSNVDPFLSPNEEVLETFRELPTRPATIDDIRLGLSIASKPGKRPSSENSTIFKREVAKLQLSDLDKKALIVLFEQGIGLISHLFPIDYNKYIIEVFRKSHLSIIATDYPCQSLNLGAVSNIIVVSPISWIDLGQLWGRVKRPNSEPFQEMLKDGVLKVLTFEADFVEKSATGAETDRICHGFLSLSNIGTTLNIPHIRDELFRVLRMCLTQDSTIFPVRFQIRLEKCLEACFIRLFHPDLCVSDKSVLKRDCAFVLAKMVKQGLLNDSKSLGALPILNEHFGITASPDLADFFKSDDLKKSAAHMIPKFSAGTASELQFGDTLDSASDAIIELQICLSVVKSALAFCSLMRSDKTTFSLVNAIRTLLHGTSEHISTLLTLLSTRLKTIQKNQERSRSMVGAIVSQKVVPVVPVVPAASEAQVVPATPESQVVPVVPAPPEAQVVPVVPAASEAQVVPAPIFDDSSSSEEEFFGEEAPVGHPLINPLEDLILRALGYVKPNPAAEQVVPDVPDVPAEQVELLRSQKMILSMRIQTGINVKKTYLLLLELVKLIANPDGFVVLGIPKVLSKDTFFLVPELTEIYHKLCVFLTTSGFMLEAHHEKASDGKISSVSFDALKCAICKHDEQAEHKLVSNFSKEENEALLADVDERLSKLNGL